MNIGRLIDALLGRVPCLRQRVIVNLTDPDQAIAGVLWSQRGGWLVIKQPQLLRAGVPAVPMDGDAVIERARVLFIQAGVPA